MNTYTASHQRQLREDKKHAVTPFLAGHMLQNPKEIQRYVRRKILVHSTLTRIETENIQRIHELLDRLVHELKSAKKKTNTALDPKTVKTIRQLQHMTETVHKLSHGVSFCINCGVEGGDTETNRLLNERGHFWFAQEKTQLKPAKHKFTPVDRLNRKIYNWAEKQVRNPDRQTHYKALDNHFGTQTDRKKSSLAVVTLQDLKWSLVAPEDVLLHSIVETQTGPNETTVLSVLPQNTLNYLDKAQVKTEIVPFKLVNKDPELLKTALKLYKKAPQIGYEKYVEMLEHI